MLARRQADGHVAVIFLGHGRIEKEAEVVGRLFIAQLKSLHAPQGKAAHVVAALFEQRDERRRQRLLGGLFVQPQQPPLVALVLVEQQGDAPPAHASQ